ncbi:phosphate transport system permease protein [Friedmanniella endophytica]|uniref:Phosphate transport system permease protein PstA n=1 Tax=Microlunatus kandeliicorticis TaxID=1759536 RepID=A0A7W3IVV3_9ACTN|nr:phosphate ABC transporter permease PstA [Microlunatus kandeliicorticis]MBA8796202.1 phosphate transport system permease protein [Microlunatus kandeliicorticis]
MSPRGPRYGSRTQRQLPNWFLGVTGVGSVVVGTAGALGLGGGPVACVVLALVIFVIGSSGIAIAVEGRRRGINRLATILVCTAFGIAMVPLVSVVYVVIKNGLARFDVQFFTYSLSGVIGAGGGAYHAIVGTVYITLLTAVISVPIGILCSIYLVEYGRGPLARAITFFVDVMTGIPSIVAGLFAFALFELVTQDPGYRSGLAGAVALSVLMIPVVVRSTEEVLRLVPAELREASYALGTRKWKTIVRIVLPTAIGGIVTGVTISIARVTGETAPLLLTAGFSNATNTNLFDGRMANLPEYIYFQFTNPGVPVQAGVDRAWTAALVLIMIVMLLNLLARLVARIFRPKIS